MGRSVQKFGKNRDMFRTTAAWTETETDVKSVTPSLPALKEGLIEFRI